MAGPDEVPGGTEGGIASIHPQMALHVHVAPTVADEFNTIRNTLVTVACWRLDDIRFEFDSSFVLPEAIVELKRLGALKKSYADSPISLFGHADPVGNDTYNKKLSGRRVIAIYALLTRDTDKWEKLYKQPHGGDNWGLKSTQRILELFGYYPGPNDGLMGSETKRAVKNFQTDNGLGVDGDPGPNTRRKLWELYMDRICVDDEGTPFRYETTEFLGKGADPDGKADYQGCSEFNPVLLFSEEENKEFEQNSDKQPRNAANSPNRRVVAFFFRPDSEVDIQKWPCPKAKDGTADCRKRFWSDSKERLSFQEERREYKETRDTMGCRFYDRFARKSPCEAGFKEWVLRILEDGPSKLPDRRPLINEPYVVTGVGGAAAEVVGATDANGVLRVRAFSDTATMVLKIAGLIITLDGGALLPVKDDNGVRQRLFNLGYGRGDPLSWTEIIFKTALNKFQKENDLAEGPADDATRAKLKQTHGS